MKVLVTGATSLIGRHLVAKLIGRGDVVTTLQRRPSGAGEREILASILDRDAIATACEGQEAVVHLAAKVGATGSWDEYKATNIDGSGLLREAARRSGVAAFVHVSSPSVAHGGSSLIGAGASPADPRSTRGHYATSKAVAEVEALAASSEAMPIVAIRPHLVWGPGDTQLVARIVDRAKAGRLPLIGSGLALIDSTYIDNAADALVAALDRSPNLGGNAYVVANGEPRTVHELVARILVAAGISWSPRHVPARAAIVGGSAVERLWERAGRDDDPPMTSFLAEQLSTAHWFDQRETQMALGWVPSVTMAEGFDRLADSFRV